MPIERRPTGNRTLSLPLLLKSRQVYTLVLHVYGREFEIAVTPQLIDPLYDNDFEWTDSAYFVLFILIAICFVYICNALLLFVEIQSKNHYFWLVYCLCNFGAFHLIATSGYGSLFLFGAFPFVEVNAAILQERSAVWLYWRWQVVLCELHRNTLYMPNICVTSVCFI